MVKKQNGSLAVVSSKHTKRAKGKGTKPGKVKRVPFYGPDKIAKAVASIAQGMAQYDEALTDRDNAYECMSAAKAELNQRIREAVDSNITVEPSGGGKINPRTMPVRYALNQALLKMLPHIADTTRMNYLRALVIAINEEPHVFNLNPSRAKAKAKGKGKGGRARLIERDGNVYSLNFRLGKGGTSGAAMVKAAKQLAAAIKASPPDNDALKFAAFLVDVDDAVSGAGVAPTSTTEQQ